MDDGKICGRTVSGPYPFTFRIRGKGEEQADELIKRIESSLLTELIQKYLDAAKEVKRNKKLSPEDKLKELLPPLNEILKITFPNYLKHHQFVDDRYIDLKREIDLENLAYDPSKYSLLGGTEFEKTGLLNLQERNISVSEEYLTHLTLKKWCKQLQNFGVKARIEEGAGGYDLIYPQEIEPVLNKKRNIIAVERRIKAKEQDSGPPFLIPPPASPFLIPPLSSKKTTKEAKPEARLRGEKMERKITPPALLSISEIYDDWLWTLDPDTIKSSDLLTQVLVCYTIRRALNGNKGEAQLRKVILGG